MWLLGRRERGFARSSSGCSRMLRIPKHSAFTLWPRTDAAPSDQWVRPSALAYSHKLRVPLRLRRLVFEAEC